MKDQILKKKNRILLLKLINYKNIFNKKIKNQKFKSTKKQNYNKN